MISFLPGLVLHVLAYLCAQGGNRIKFFAQTSGPFVVSLRKFFDSHGRYPGGVFNFPSGKSFGGKILRIINHKRLFVVRLHAGQIVRKFLLNPLGAKRYLNLVFLDVLLFESINLIAEKLALDVNGYSVSERGATVLDWLHGSGIFS